MLSAFGCFVVLIAFFRASNCADALDSLLPPGSSAFIDFGEFRSLMENVDRDGAQFDSSMG